MPALKEMDSANLFPLKAIKNNEDYESALSSMELVFDESDGPPAEYAETLSILIEYYEDKHFQTSKAAGVDVLKFLMEQNGLKQKDLVGLLGSKSTVSEILSGKRPLNLKHIKLLSEQFNVKPATFV